VAEKSGQGRKNGPGAVSRFSPVVAYSFLKVFSPARVATWRAFEVPWAHSVATTHNEGGGEGPLRMLAAVPLCYCRKTLKSFD
jgi:hypothetical protein